MINISECFNMIGINGCGDVATSLAMQGTEPEISIPVYEVFYLKLLAGEKTNFLAGSIPELNAIRQMAMSCGAVAASINILDMDILTLLGAVLIYTPDTGMNIFVKDCIPDIVNIAEDIVEAVINLTPLAAGADNMVQASFISADMAVKAIDWLVNLLIDRLDSDTGHNGISIRRWEELPEYYNYIKSSGEMTQMSQYRQMINAPIL